MVMVMEVTKRNDQVLQLEKKKEKNKNHCDQGKGIKQVFCFGTQDIIEGVSVFRIDSQTIKRRKSFAIAVIKVPLGE